VSCSAGRRIEREKSFPNFGPNPICRSGVLHSTLRICSPESADHSPSDSERYGRLASRHSASMHSNRGEPQPMRLVTARQRAVAVVLDRTISDRTPCRNLANSAPVSPLPSPYPGTGTKVPSAESTFAERGAKAITLQAGVKSPQIPLRASPTPPPPRPHKDAPCIEASSIGKHREMHGAQSVGSARGKLAKVSGTHIFHRLHVKM
jgi:hypothetical protein